MSEVNGLGITLPFTTFISKFAFAISSISMIIYIFVNRGIRVMELMWHIMFVSSFVWNTECLSSNKKCSFMAALAMLYPVLYLITFTYFNLKNATEQGSSEKRYDIIGESGKVKEASNSTAVKKLGDLQYYQNELN